MNITLLNIKVNTLFYNIPYFAQGGRNKHKKVLYLQRKSPAAKRLRGLVYLAGS